MQQWLLTVMVLCAGGAGASAQGDLAYMPKTAPAMTADDERIVMTETEDPERVELQLPPGTFQLDLINSAGNVVEQYDAADRMGFDLAGLRPGTWTLRARTPHGFRVRRFVVHNREGQNWVVEARPVPRRKPK